MRPASGQFLPGLSCSIESAALRACFDVTLTVLRLSSYLLDTTLVLDAQANLASVLATLQQRVEFFHRDFEVRPVQHARRMPGEALEVFLLRPEARAIPLTGRRLEFRALWDWVHRDEVVNVCVMGVGPGAGKTRLAFELLLALQRQKNGDNSPQLPPRWRIGRVSIDSLRKFDHTKDWALWVWDRPTVIMVDYEIGRAHV